MLEPKFTLTDLTDVGQRKTRLTAARIYAVDFEGIDSCKVVAICLRHGTLERLKFEEVVPSG